MIEIMNLRTGTRSEIYDVRVDGMSKYANQFCMKDESERDKVCNAYKDWFDNEIRLKSKQFEPLLTTYKKFGKLRLWCWCAPKRCHAETIRDYILAQSS